MSSRNPGYITSVVLLAIVCSLPQILTASIIAHAFGVQLGRNPTLSQYKRVLSQSLLPVPGIDETTFATNAVLLASFSHGKFVWTGAYYEGWQLFLGYQETDPETGETDFRKTGTQFRNIGSGWLETFTLGNQLWFRDAQQVFEVVDGKLNPSSFTPPPKWTARESFFIWNGKPAFVEDTNNGFIVSALETSGWTEAGKIKLPQSAVPFPQGGLSSKSADKLDIQIRNLRDTVHLFLNLDGRLFYREGFELTPVSKAAANQPGQNDHASNEPVSALLVNNDDQEFNGWSLVHPFSNDFGMLGYGMKPPTYLGLFLQGQPAALAFEQVSVTERIVRAFRFDGTEWTKFASQALPFGTSQWRTVSTTDGQRSYLVVSTSTGSAHIYSVDSNGFRETAASDKLKTPVIQGLVSMYMNRFGILPFTGLFLGIIVWHLMWWFTTPDYGFGLQTVRLASLGWRGFARLIDFGLIGLTAFGLGWLATRNVDWPTLFESLNLRIDHPTVSTVRQAAMIMSVCLVTLLLAMIAAQARWGTTPGKWLFGLRTVRSSLRPCGFTRSLARELVLLVDCCNFFCWTPGIVSIAFTDRRQRLGDLVADTIVIESRSLAPLQLNSKV